MKKPEEELGLNFRKRSSETISIEIPSDTLASIKSVAANRDMSYQALLKFYVGQGLRQDLTKLFADHVLETTAQVLARHIESEEQVSAILQEIRTEASG